MLVNKCKMLIIDVTIHYMTYLITYKLLEITLRPIVALHLICT